MSARVAPGEVVALHLVVLKLDLFAINVLPEGLLEVGDVAGFQAIEHLLLLLLALELLLRIFVVEIHPELNLDENLLIHLDFVQDSEPTDLGGQCAKVDRLRARSPPRSLRSARR